MNQTHQQLEDRLIQAARHLPYPSTPDLAGRVRTPRPTAAPDRRGRNQWAWVGGIAVLLLLVLLAVPPVRAAVVEALRFGAVRIFLNEPTPVMPPTATPLSAVPAETEPPPPTPDLLNLAGETTLAEAQAQVDFPLRYPADFGPPDRVFVQQANGPLVVLVWLATDNPGQVELSLHLLGPTTFAGKGAPETIEETSVNGEPALWLQGPHLLQLGNGSYGPVRLVEGNVLLWTEADITYRLETGATLTDAIRLAESLREP